MSVDINEEMPLPEEVAVVGVKVRDLGEVKKTRTEDTSIKVGDWVILDLEPDQTYGKVYLAPQHLPFSPPMRVMRSVTRKATEADKQAIERQQRLAEEGKAFCYECIEALGLRMKLVEVYGTLSRRSLTFTYTAEDRIDFRQLVKDLARRFGCRIEMRQISTREEAGRLGGVDTCGLVLCCASFLTDFKPVYPRGRPDGPQGNMDGHRIGVCGRLKCCLLYEEEGWTLSPRKPQPLIRPVKRGA
ncbi:MAG: regulatory iron-sulfur-containing complex subunit RicT [Nitrospirales bacterium]|nr:PSP1 domain-containing protein [Nitrospirales bacterium]